MQTTTHSTKIHTSVLQFPEIKCHPSDAHKIRGYFGNLFKNHSSILHNHFEDGKSMYRYPLVQYKIVRNVPTLVGLAEGAKLMTELFLDIKELNINNEIIPILHKNFESNEVEVGVSTRLTNYRFVNLWMALNQKNHKQYNDASMGDRQEMLRKILVGNILSFFKGFDHRVTEQIMVHVSVKENFTHFKNQKMLAFQGEFVSNVLLPDFIGLGKSVARGFGTVKRLK